MRVYLFLMSANLIENVLSQKFLQALLCSTVSRTFEQSLERLLFFLFVCMPAGCKGHFDLKRNLLVLVSILLEWTQNWILWWDYCTIRCKYLRWVPLIKTLYWIRLLPVHSSGYRLIIMLEKWVPNLHFSEIHC